VCYPCTITGDTNTAHQQAGAKLPPVSADTDEFLEIYCKIQILLKYCLQC
jgi:hypothetical protein